MCEGGECTRQYRETWVRLPSGEYLYKMEEYRAVSFAIDPRSELKYPVEYGWRTVVEDVVSENFVPYDQSRRELVQWRR